MALRFSTAFRNKRAGIKTNMVANGSFTSATTSWTAVDATLSSVAGGQSGNCLQVAESGGANPGKAYQDITTKVGRVYQLDVYFKKGTADYGKYMIGTTGSEAAIFDSGNLNDAAWAKKTTYFAATATTTRITMESVDATVGETSLFDEIKLVDLTASMQAIFAGGQIDVYSGAQPSSANAAPTGTLLCSFTNGGSGITFDDAAAGVLSKAAAETWSGVVGSAGTAGWFRLHPAGDSGADDSSTLNNDRMDGSIATSGAELNFTSTAFALGATETITTFTVTEPGA